MPKAKLYIALFLLVATLTLGIFVTKNKGFSFNINEKAAILECFPEGTKISLNSGDTKNIEEFKIGDKVLSENIVSGKKETGNTTKLWKLWSLNMCSVSFEDGDTLKLTNPHPLFTKEGWKAINVKEAIKHNPDLSITQLTTNDFVKKQDDSWSKVTDISCKYGLFRVYNLAIDTNNNYFAQEYLVHNKATSVVDVPGVKTVLDTNGKVIKQYDENTGKVIDNNLPPEVISPVGHTCVTNVACGSGYRCVGSPLTCQSSLDTLNGVRCRGQQGCGGSDSGFVCIGSSPDTATCVSESSITNLPANTSCGVNTPGVPESIGVCCVTSATTSYDYETGQPFTGDYHWTTCATGYSCKQNEGCFPSGTSKTPPPSNPEPTPNVTPTPPTITASCQNVKAYTTTWTELTTAGLSQLKSGNSINFCVAGVATGGSFDKARFTINGTLQPETTTIRPSSTDFCQLYNLPTGVTNYNVTAEIHHVTLGWK